MESLIIAVMAGVLAAVSFILAYLIRGMRKKEEKEEIREKAQEKRLRLLDMLTVYGFQFHTQSPSDSVSLPLTVAGMEKQLMSIHVYCGRHLEERIEFQVLFDPTFSMVLGDPERMEHLKQYLHFLERSRIWKTPPWVSAHLDSSSTGRMLVEVRDRNDISGGGGLLI